MSDNTDSGPLVVKSLFDDEESLSWVQIPEE
jgi:hypothetical protein